VPATAAPSKAKADKAGKKKKKPAQD
jgi:hypothetical protein